MAKKKAKKTVKKAAKKSVKSASKKTAAAAAPKRTTINPYLVFNGNCEEAFMFYKSVFGGKFGYLGRFSEMPPMDGQSVPASEANKIMHVSLPITNESVLMGSDTSDAFGMTAVQGTNFSISVSAASRATADKIYKGLSAGGKAVMPMANMFWGSYFGMLVDKFGIQWQVSFDTAPM